MLEKKNFGTSIGDSPPPISYTTSKFSNLFGRIFFFQFFNYVNFLIVDTTGQNVFLHVILLNKHFFTSYEYSATATLQF